MRVIGGTFRSRLLRAPAGAATRPTSDRLRETMFNVIAARVAGAMVMDLYAGTGAVGIEALSRGAEHVLFVESDPAALRVLRANLQSLDIASGFAVSERPVGLALKRRFAAEQDSRRFDLVFLDPPYEQATEYLASLNLLGSAAAATVLERDVLIIAEHATRRPLGDSYGLLRRTRTLQQGDASLSFFQVSSASHSYDGDAVGEAATTDEPPQKPR